MKDIRIQVIKVWLAEGIETKTQADFLKERGCREMQGYYFYKPMPVEDFEKAFEKCLSNEKNDNDV